MTRIEGKTLDAELMRRYFSAWGDREAYAVSHVGRGVAFVDELPKNALGKVQKSELRKLL